MLVEVRFINCQSMSDVTMHFADDKLNVIVADNSVGKSVLFKMLKVTANPKVLPTREERMQVIRYGTTHAAFICAFDDGDVGATIVYPNKVIYKYRSNKSENFISYEQPPEIFIKHLGLLVDDKINYIANLIDTDQDLLFVNNNLGSNHSLIKLIAENPTLTEVQDKLTNLDNQFNQYAVYVNQKAIDLRMQLEQFSYSDVNRLEADLDCVEIMLDVLPKLDKCNQSLECMSIAKDVKSVDVLIEACSLLLKLDNGLNCIDYNYTEKDKVICDVAPVVMNAVEQIRLVNIDTTDYESLDSAMRLLCQIKTSMDSIECVDVFSDDLITLSENLNVILNSINRIISSVSLIENSKVDIVELERHLLESGESVECPIYGKVVYNGQECIPYS